MANIPVTDTRVSTTLVFQPADPAGDSFENDGSMSIIIIGPSTGFSVFVQNARDSNFGEHPPFEIILPVGETQAQSPRLDPYRFNNGAGIVEITYSSAVGVQVAVMSLHLLLMDPE